MSRSHIDNYIGATSFGGMTHYLYTEKSLNPNASEFVPRSRTSRKEENTCQDKTRDTPPATNGLVLNGTIAEDNTNTASHSYVKFTTITDVKNNTGYAKKLNPDAFEFIPRDRLPQKVDDTYDITGNTSLTPKTAMTCAVIENDKATTHNSSSKKTTFGNQNNNKSCKKEEFEDDLCVSFLIRMAGHFVTLKPYLRVAHESARLHLAEKVDDVIVKADDIILDVEVKGYDVDDEDADDDENVFISFMC